MDNAREHSRSSKLLDKERMQQESKEMVKNYLTPSMVDNMERKKQ